MEMQSTFQFAVYYSYYVSQVLLIFGFLVLGWRLRNTYLLIAAAALAVFLIGNIELLSAGHRLEDARQRHVDLTAYEHSYTIWRLVSATGFALGGLSAAVAAVLTPRRLRK